MLAAAGPRLALRLPGPPVRRGLLVLLVVLAAAWLARLPFGVAAHWWRRRHGLSDQSYPGWLVDPWLELVAGALVAAAAVAAGMLLARHLGRRWWIAGGPLLAAAGALVVLAQPLVMAPRLDPLADRRLAAQIERLGAELGVDVDRVLVKEAARRTTRINAEVTGFGPTRSVVLWDTLLDGRASEDEIRFIAAHELAHVASRHVWKGVAWFALLATPIAFAIAAAARSRGGLGVPGAVPAAVLAAVALQLVLLPFANAVSRRYEAEADWVALRATDDADAAVALYRRFAADNLGDPDPPAWSRVLLGTHPALVDRVALAEAFRSRRAEAPPAGS